MLREEGDDDNERESREMAFLDYCEKESKTFSFFFSGFSAENIFFLRINGVPFLILFFSPFLYHQLSPLVRWKKESYSQEMENERAPRVMCGPSFLSSSQR